MGGEQEFPYQSVLAGNHRFSERSVEPVKIGSAVFGPDSLVGHNCVPGAILL